GRLPVAGRERGTDKSVRDGSAILGYRNAGIIAPGRRIYTALRALFLEGHDMIISRAPLRVSFFGGGTDYPEHFRAEGGAVLATGIDKYCHITASSFMSHLFDYTVRVSYRKVELVQNVSDLEHNVYRECMKLCGLERDSELHAVAALPEF